MSALLAAPLGLVLAVIAWRTRGTYPTRDRGHHAACIAAALCLVVVTVAGVEAGVL